jgi:putative nucleotidyltransferase with HDIG domain
MASIAGEDVSFAVLGDLIEKDTVIAANVLRVVNSAVYARRGSVNSVRHALSVLGIEKVRNTVLAMSIARMLHQTRTPTGWSMERFNRHSAAVAMFADMLAQRTNTDYPEGAFVGGLLHDMGQLLVAMALPSEYAEIRRAAARSQRSTVACELEVLGFDHTLLSADALEEWKIPQQILDAVAAHHSIDPPESSNLTLAHVLRAADEVIDVVGLTIEDPLPIDDADARIQASLSTIGLSDKAQVELMEQFETEYKAIADIYQ